MSKRAEEAAMKAYPKRKDGRVRGYTCTDDDIRKVYAQGYRKAEKDLGWHSVDESLPEMDEEVIVLLAEWDNVCVEPLYRISFGHLVDKRYAIDFNGWNIPGVKFWMPMPKIPIENEST